jgi:hypothetical protein
MIGLFALLPGRDWLYITAFMVLLGGGIGFVHHEREIGAARVEAVRKAEHDQMAAVAASAAASAATETARRQAAFQETAHAIEVQTARVAADAASAVAARDALRVQLGAYVRANRVPSNPTPAASSPAAANPVDLLAELFRRADQRAGELAKVADDRGTAGTGCVLSADSLTPNRPKETP